MPKYDVVFNRTEKFSSDAAVGTNPTPTSTIVGALQQANIAVVEADSPQDAEQAVQVTYNGIAGDVEVWGVDDVVEFVPDAEPVVEKAPEPVVAEPVVEKVPDATPDTTTAQDAPTADQATDQVES